MSLFTSIFRAVGKTREMLSDKATGRGIVAVSSCPIVPATFSLPVLCLSKRKRCVEVKFSLSPTAGVQRGVGKTSPDVLDNEGCRVGGTQGSSSSSWSSLPFQPSLKPFKSFNLLPIPISLTEGAPLSCY